jgi:hypothetical protein
MLLLLGTVVFALPQAVASIDWPTTEGVVLTSAIEEVGWSDNEGWCPSVRYAYTVGGKKYVFDRVEIQSICNGSTDYYAGEVIRRYPVGKRVVVFYNPQNPAFAVLEPGIPDNEFYMPILTILPTFGGIILFWLGLLSVLGVVKYPKSSGRSSNDQNTS